MKKEKETIYALSTPPGKSAIAIIRVSGPRAHDLVEKISTNMPTKTNTAVFNKIKINNEMIDQTVTTFYKSPKSFTGEDMVEITTHGSGAVIKKLFSFFSETEEARMANPGEFTRRAFENNKLDLTQVEAIADIVNAETEMQRKQAINNLSGNFFKSSQKTFNSLKAILANIEAFIDFSEEELPVNLMEEIKEQIENNIKEIKNMLENSSLGLSIRDGFEVAILGKPNSGKSSFINAISDKSISIVTDIPGTTRDLIESFIDLSGYPVKFVDTAGIRKTNNFIEKLGIEKALDASKNSNVNIVFIENNNDKECFNKIKNKIFVRSKQDVHGGRFQDIDFYNISSKTNYGIKNLLYLVKEKIEASYPKEKSYISRERHISCLSAALESLEKSKKNTSNIDIFAEDVRLSIKSFSALFGRVDIEDILDIIFSDFCIGK